MPIKLQKSLIVTFFLFCFLSLSFSALTVSSINDPVIDQPILLSKYSEDLSQIRTKMIIDNDSNFHNFVQISYYNGSFVILHIINNQVMEIDRQINPGEIFETYLTDSGVKLVYSYSGSYFGTLVRVYDWSESGSENTRVFSSISRYIPLFLQYENNVLHILYSDYSQGNTSVNDLQIHDNGTEITNEYIIPYDGHTIRSMCVINQTVFTLHDFDRYSIDLYVGQELVIVGINENGYYNSTKIIPTDFIWFDSRLIVGDDFQFRIILYQSFSGVLYSKKFSVNESVDFFNFLEISTGYSYVENLEIFIYENNSYYVIQRFENIYEVRDSGFYYSSIPKIVIIRDDFQTLTAETIDVTNASRVNYFYSLSSYIFENSSYIISYTSLVETRSESEYRFLDRYVVSLNILSDLHILQSQNPLLFNLKNLSAFTYFWVRYWAAIIVPLLVLGIIYLIFYKRINYSLRKLRAFLLRPIVENVSKPKLIFTNIWLFITNSSSLIFSLWKSNKRRLTISLLGLTILSSIIVTSTTLFDSKRASLIVNHVESADLNNDGFKSILYTLSLESYSGLGVINENITQAAINEILLKLTSSTAVYSNSLRGYQYSLYSYVTGYNFSEYANYISYLGYLGFTENYTSVISSIIEEGSLPSNLSEVLIASDIADTYDIEINDNIIVNASGYVETIEVDSTEFKVVGIYKPPSLSYLRNLCKENDVPFDPIQAITSFDNIIAPKEFYLRNFGNITRFNLDLFGHIQMLYDFSGISFDEVNILIEEIEELQVDSPYQFSFDSASDWMFLNELYYVFNDITFTLQTTQFLIIFISIPILYLAWFLIFEVNELFGASFAQEIRILRSKGVSTGNISFVYTSMKLFESIIATGLGFVITLVLLPPLLKIDRFVSFGSEIYGINFDSLPIAMGLTFIFLMFVSLPRIIKQSRTKRKIEKIPRKMVHLLKRFRLHYFLIIIIGAGETLLAFWLFQLFGIQIIGAENSILVMVFVYLMGIGVMISLLGLGLILKELHKLIMIVLSKITWLSRKNIFSFSMVEIRSDIDLFNNTFLTYLILIGIILPFIVTPVNIQDNVNIETYFYNGSDLYIKNWNTLDQTLRSNLSLYDEISSITNITVYHGLYGEYGATNGVLNIMVLDNPNEFLATIQKPPKYLTPNWDESITNLNQNNSIFVSNIFDSLLAQEEPTFTFYSNVNSSIVEYHFNITGVFDYFPIFYDVGPITNQNRYMQSFNEFSLVTSWENFLTINQTLNLVGTTFDRLLIKISSRTDPENFAIQIEKDLNIDVEVSAENYETRLNNLIPFYSLLVAEFIFGILICIAAVAFTSISNPMKILQRRITKHDVLKKIGIPTNRIIFLSALELFISCIVPGLILGAASGYGLIKLLDFILLGFRYNSLPYVMPFPFGTVIIVFLGIPVIFYGIYFVAMKYNFAKYMPRNLE
ncbi:MAG: hypothetical protein KAS63_10525 [Candidatus Heimdallarchaeota archaeon]|nr:hypothetical protein [Candidatus Heimdallarchaeota archaeon]MCK4955789.1 hypothetical protein [Candidatus Heimdallarchaeota archaeon]